MEQLQVHLQQALEQRLQGAGAWPWQPPSLGGSGGAGGTGSPAATREGRQRRQRPRGVVKSDGQPLMLLFPREVQQQLQMRTEELAHNLRTSVERFHQSANREVDRLRSHAQNVIDSLVLSTSSAATPLPFACMQFSPSGGLSSLDGNPRVKGSLHLAATRLKDLSQTTNLNAMTAGSLTPDSSESDCGRASVSTSENLAPLALAAAPEEEATKASAFEDKGIAIVTTASLPWLTGSAVNPLLRAAQLADKCKQVTLVVPWLPPSEQPVVHSNKMTFDSPAEQEEYVRNWLQATTGKDHGSKLRVTFYPSRYSRDKHSILALGDVTQCIPSDSSDLVVLEEPEHLTWYHHGRRWTDAFPRVIGIMHTNYIEYASREPGGALLAWALFHVNRWMCRVHCNQVVKLSDAVQLLPRSSTCNVNGVADRFLRIGERRAGKSSDGLYYIAKMQWGKGYAELLNLLNKHPFTLDSYGSGGDADAIVQAAKDAGLPVKFHGHLEGQGRYDHGSKTFEGYRTFINPSISEVVATTTAEALAMNKHVVVPNHPSNAFFAAFPNCHIYSHEDESGNDFSSKLRQAMSEEPAPLSPEKHHSLSWEAATQRFLDIAAAPPPKEGLALETLDNALAKLHHTLSAVPLLRVMAGAGPVSLQDSPLNRLTRQQVEEFQQFMNFTPAHPPSPAAFAPPPWLKGLAAQAS